MTDQAPSPPLLCGLIGFILNEAQSSALFLLFERAVATGRGGGFCNLLASDTERSKI
jgi:hypothetical protein